MVRRNLERRNFLPGVSQHDKDMKLACEQIDTLRMQLQSRKLEGARKRASEIFWKTLRNDVEMYEKEICLADPLHNTCYRKCKGCAMWYDKAYYQYKLVGYRRRQSPKIYKVPLRTCLLISVFIGGIFKVLRANQDGSASFVGTIFNLANQILAFVIFLADDQFVMAVPKLGSSILSMAILYGIVVNAGDAGVGI